MIDWIVIKLMQWRLRKQWGAGLCESRDLWEFPGLKADERCGACIAQDFSEWLDEWGNYE